MKTCCLTEEDVSSYIYTLREEFPKLKIHHERPSWLQRILACALFRRFGWQYATQAIGNNIYLSDNWKILAPKYQLEILRHERQHLLDFQKYGVILFSILYLFIFFPVGLAYFRAKFERKGYAESLAALIEYEGASPSLKIREKDFYLRMFTGPTYLWMWPFKKIISSWFEEDWEKAIRRCI